MKKRVFGLTFLTMLCLLLLCGCTCDPSAYMWYVDSFQKNTAYINGVEQVVTYGGVPTMDEPFAGMQDGIVQIQFSEDETVSFHPGTGENLTGTFTLKHNGMKNTSFTVTLDNGETFSGTAEDYYYGRSLRFTFRDMQYCFEEAFETAEVLYEQNLQDVALYVRQWVKSDRTDSLLKRGTVAVEDGGYVLRLEDREDPISLDNTVAVQCVRLDAENNLTHLKTIEEGECYCVIYVPSSSMVKIVIYYIEPLPEEPTVPTEPDHTYLSDLRTWLRDLEVYEDTYIKMTREFETLPPGYVKYHRYITDESEMEDILSQLKQIKLIEATPEEFAARTSDEILTLRIYSGSYELVIASHHGYFIRAEYDYYRLEDFPEFDYTNAVRSFIVSENAVAQLYDGDEYRGTYPDLDLYEFVVDTEEHDYTSAHYWTLVCEFGEIQIYDDTHFRYKGQNYVITGEYTFGFAQIPQ